VTAASQASAQYGWLQNDDFEEGQNVGCSMAVGDGSAFAALFTASPTWYPYEIERIRILHCGAGDGIITFTIWQDAGNLNPGTLLFASSDTYLFSGTPGGAQFIDIVIPPGTVPMITNGTIRVGIDVLFSSPGFAYDISGITANRNFFRNGTTWSYTENFPLNLPGDWVLRLGVVTPPTAVDDEQVPSGFALVGNFPNPFNPTTTIRYDVPVRGGHVNLSVFDVTGRHVQTLVDDHRDGGRFDVQWDGRGARGERLGSGVYFLRMRAGAFTEAKKIVLLE
jgi:hypothetical protein